MRPVCADEPVTITRIVISLERPFCGLEISEEGSDPEPEARAYAEDEELEDAVDKVNEKLVNYKKIKKTVLRKEEFEKNTSRKIKRY